MSAKVVRRPSLKSQRSLSRMASKADFEQIRDEWVAACVRQNVQLSKSVMGEFNKRIKQSGEVGEKAKLNFSKCGLDDKKIILLVDILASKPIISKLDLTKNDISDVGALKILSLLEEQKMIAKTVEVDQRLDLSLLSEVLITNNKRAPIEMSVLHSIQEACESLKFANAQVAIRSAYINMDSPEVISVDGLMEIWTQVIEKPNKTVVKSAFQSSLKKDICPLNFEELEIVLLEGLFKKGYAKPISDKQLSEVMYDPAAASSTTGSYEYDKDSIDLMTPATLGWENHNNSSIDLSSQSQQSTKTSSGLGLGKRSDVGNRSGEGIASGVFKELTKSNLSQSGSMKLPPSSLATERRPSALDWAATFDEEDEHREEIETQDEVLLSEEKQTEVLKTIPETQNTGKEIQAISDSPNKLNSSESVDNKVNLSSIAEQDVDTKKALDNLGVKSFESVPSDVDRSILDSPVSTSIKDIILKKDQVPVEIVLSSELFEPKIISQNTVVNTENVASVQPSTDQKTSPVKKNSVEKPLVTSSVRGNDEHKLSKTMDKKAPDRLADLMDIPMIEHNSTDEEDEVSNHSKCNDDEDPLLIKLRSVESMLKSYSKENLLKTKSSDQKAPASPRPSRMPSVVKLPSVSETGTAGTVQTKIDSKEATNAADEKKIETKSLPVNDSTSQQIEIVVLKNSVGNSGDTMVKHDEKPISPDEIEDRSIARATSNSAIAVDTQFISKNQFSDQSEHSNITAPSASAVSSPLKTLSSNLIGSRTADSPGRIKAVAAKYTAALSNNDSSPTHSALRQPSPVKAMAAAFETKSSNHGINIGKRPVIPKQASDKSSNLLHVEQPDVRFSEDEKRSGKNAELSSPPRISDLNAKNDTAVKSVSSTQQIKSFATENAKENSSVPKSALGRVLMQNGATAKPNTSKQECFQGKSDSKNVKGFTSDDKGYKSGLGQLLLNTNLQKKLETNKGEFSANSNIVTSKGNAKLEGNSNSLYNAIPRKGSAMTKSLSFSSESSKDDIDSEVIAVTNVNNLFGKISDRQVLDAQSSSPTSDITASPRRVGSFTLRDYENSAKPIVSLTHHEPRTNITQVIYTSVNNNDSFSSKSISRSSSNVSSVTPRHFRAISRGNSSSNLLSNGAPKALERHRSRNNSSFRMSDMTETIQEMPSKEYDIAVAVSRQSFSEEEVKERSEYISLPKEPDMIKLQLLELSFQAFPRGLDFNAFLDSRQYGALQVLLLRKCQLSSLQVLQLQKNFPHLTDLDLSYNWIEESITESDLPFSLLRADLSYNCFTNIDGLLACVNLLECNLSHNNIKLLHGLPPKINTLDMSNNSLSNTFALRVFVQCADLEVLNIADNPLVDSKGMWRSKLRSQIKKLRILNGEVLRLIHIQKEEKKPDRRVTISHKEQSVNDKKRMDRFKVKEKELSAIQKAMDLELRGAMVGPQRALSMDEISEITKRLLPKTPKTAPPVEETAPKTIRKSKKISKKKNDGTDIDESFEGSGRSTSPTKKRMSSPGRSLTVRTSLSSPTRRRRPHSPEYMKPTASSVLRTGGESPVRKINRGSADNTTDFPRKLKVKDWLEKAKLDLFSSANILMSIFDLGGHPNQIKRNLATFADELRSLELYSNKDFITAVDIDSVTSSPMRQKGTISFQNVYTMQEKLQKMLYLLHQIESALVLCANKLFNLKKAFNVLMASDIGQYVNSMVLVPFGLMFKPFAEFDNSRHSRNNSADSLSLLTSATDPGSPHDGYNSSPNRLEELHDSMNSNKTGGIATVPSLDNDDKYRYSVREEEIGSTKARGRDADTGDDGQADALERMKSRLTIRTLESVVQDDESYQFASFESSPAKSLISNISPIKHAEGSKRDSLSAPAVGSKHLNYPRDPYIKTSTEEIEDQELAEVQIANSEVMDKTSKAEIIRRAQEEENERLEQECLSTLAESNLRRKNKNITPSDPEAIDLATNLDSASGVHRADDNMIGGDAFESAQIQPESNNSAMKELERAEEKTEVSKHDKEEQRLEDEEMKFQEAKKAEEFRLAEEAKEKARIAAEKRRELEEQDRKRKLKEIAERTKQAAAIQAKEEEAKREKARLEAMHIERRVEEDRAMARIRAEEEAAEKVKKREQDALEKEKARLVAEEKKKAQEETLQKLQKRAARIEEIERSESEGLDGRGLSPVVSANTTPRSSPSKNAAQQPVLNQQEAKQPILLKSANSETLDAPADQKLPLNTPALQSAVQEPTLQPSENRTTDSHTLSTTDSPSVLSSNQSDSDTLPTSGSISNLAAESSSRRLSAKERIQARLEKNKQTK